MTTWTQDDPDNWTSFSTRDDGDRMVLIPDRVCSSCRRGECAGCTGLPSGKRYERTEEATKRLGPGCLCAEQGHPKPVTCSEMAGGAGRGETAHRCGKLVKGSVLARGRWGSEEHEHFVCGQHLAMYRRRGEKAAADAARKEALTEANRQAFEERTAADEVAAMLNEAGAVIGLDLAAEATGGSSYGGPRPVTIRIDHEAAGALARFLIDRHS